MYLNRECRATQEGLAVGNSPTALDFVVNVLGWSEFQVAGVCFRPISGEQLSAKIQITVHISSSDATDEPALVKGRLSTVHPFAEAR